MSRTVVADLRYEMTGLAARLARFGIVVDEDLEHLAETVTRDLYDPAQARTTAYAVMGVLWPTGWPELVGMPGWWSQEPLGVVCAHILGAVEDDRETVSHQVAADMLQVTRGTIATMVSRGTIASVPGQGVLRTAVLTRIGRGMPAWEPPPTTVTVTVEPGTKLYGREIGSIHLSPSGISHGITPDGHAVFSPEFPPHPREILTGIRLWAENVTDPRPADICTAMDATGAARDRIPVIDTDDLDDILRPLLTPEEFAAGQPEFWCRDRDGRRVITFTRQGVTYWRFFAAERGPRTYWQHD